MPAWPGLCAARELVRAGKSCVVLEARDRVGGRTLSQPLAGDVDRPGRPVDRPHAKPPGRAGRRVGRGHVSAISHRPQAAELERQAHQLRRRPAATSRCLRSSSCCGPTSAGSVRPRDSARGPWRAPRAAEWDGMTLETWKRRHVHTAGARLFVDVVTRAVLTSEPRDVSFLFFLSYLRWGKRSGKPDLDRRRRAARAVRRRRAATLRAAGRPSLRGP